MSLTKSPVKFGCSLGPEWVTWPELQEACRVIPELGFDTLWTHDNMTPADSDSMEGPNLEGWTFLSAMAVMTEGIRIGCMVTSNTFRHPAVLAKMATTVDIMSGGRLIFGIGAGWSEPEHTAYGIPFYTVGERMDRLDEAVQVIKLLWESQRPVTFEGRKYSLKDAPFDPNPVQKPHPPILIAGGGEKRTLRIVAKWADAMNVYGAPEVIAHKFQVLEQHCKEVGRDPKEIEKTVLARFVPPDRREAWDKHLEHLAMTAPDLVQRGQGQGLVGDMNEMRDWVQQRVEVGVDHVILTLRSPYPFESLENFSREVIPAFK